MASHLLGSCAQVHTRLARHRSARWYRKSRAHGVFHPPTDVTARAVHGAGVATVFWRLPPHHIANGVAPGRLTFDHRRSDPEHRISVLERRRAAFRLETPQASVSMTSLTTRSRSGGFWHFVHDKSAASGRPSDQLRQQPTPLVDAPLVMPHPSSSTDRRQRPPAL
jgi:hypothetical protein